MNPELRVNRAGGENRLDYSEIVENLQRAWLQALATGPFKGRVSGLQLPK